MTVLSRKGLLAIAAVGGLVRHRDGVVKFAAPGRRNGGRRSERRSGNQSIRGVLQERDGIRLNLYAPSSWLYP
jgi:hypothetical protein